MAIQKCSRCTRTFAKVEHLKRHERSHTGEKPYQCLHCQKRFARRDVLNRHVKGHGDRGNFRFVTSGSVPPRLIMPDGTSSRMVADSSPGPYRAVSGSLEQQPNTMPVPLSAQTAPAPSTMAMSQKLSTATAAGQPMTRMESRGSAAQAQLFPPTFPSDPRTMAGSDQMSDPFVHLSPGSPLFRDHTPCAGADSPAWLAMFNLDVPMSVNTMPYRSESNLELQSPLVRSFQPFVSRATGQDCVSSDISDERFARMASVWPRKGERPWHLMQTLWSDVMSYAACNLFSDAGAADSYPSPETTCSVKSVVGLEHEKYLWLVKEFAEDETGSNPRFPSEDTLGVCIDLYFQRFHSIMGFIHQPTFSANSAPNIVLFSICLIGLTMLDPESNRSFVSAHLSRMMDRCEAELSARTWHREESIRLCAVFAASVLLLCCAAIMPDQMCSKRTYEFYTTILSMATRHGLFEMRKSEQLQLHTIVVPQDHNDDLSWKAWARFESANRMITCLVMADALFASSAGTSPIIRTETMRLYAPCSNALFAAADVKRWHEELTRSGNGPEMKAPILDFRDYPRDKELPKAISSNGLAMHALLASVMLRIADMRQRGAEREHDNDTNNDDDDNDNNNINDDDDDDDDNEKERGKVLSKDEAALLFPCIRYSGLAPGGLTLTSFLFDVYATYQHDLKRNNPNSLAFWHKLCISLTANVELFELAAGREGPRAARQAIRRISAWAQSPIARRACLHAAQVYACMSQRKIADGTMFMSEIAIFNSALVLGMYLYVSPPELQGGGGGGGGPDSTNNITSGARTCLELLDDVDWTCIGDQGLRADTVPREHYSSLAERFIAEGGAVSFAGTAYPGGYCSARRVILDYVGLLQEVGRWNVRELCQILRLMGGSMVEMD